MNKLVFVIIASVAICNQLIGQLCSDTSPADLGNQNVFGINKEYYHLNVVPYTDLKSSIQMDYTQSAFYKSLNGTWKLNYVNKPADVPAEIENYTFYGRGPGENYSDRNNASMIGEYISTVKEQYFPYLSPQHTGNRTYVRWASLTNYDGIGIAVYGYPYLETTALHYGDNDLDNKSFTEIVKRDEVYFSIGLATM